MLVPNLEQVDWNMIDGVYYELNQVLEMHNQL